MRKTFGKPYLLMATGLIWGMMACQRVSKGNRELKKTTQQTSLPAITDKGVTDLSPLGFPLTIQLPENAKVNSLLSNDGKPIIGITTGEHFNLEVRYLKDEAPEALLSRMKDLFTDTAILHFKRMEEETSTYFYISNVRGPSNFWVVLPGQNGKGCYSVAVTSDYPDEVFDFTEEDVRRMFEVAKTARVK